MSRSITSKYGLVGKNISYSFSEGYFSKKFKELNLEECSYQNFDINSIKDFPKIISENQDTLKGLNVTIPYKENVLSYLDELDADADEIGAVNTIKILKNNKLKGYNTDVYGFKNSLSPLLSGHHKKALILGTGGASKAIAFVFDELQIEYLFVSRNPKNELTIKYDDLSKELLENYQIVVNCTPLGTFPNIENCPDIPYQFLSKSHLLFDLIYNPQETLFLKKGKEKGTAIKNGLEMLELQAEKAWEIWNS
ncbi:MAG: shikimate dehydrogenase [Bacteroidota bacterium]